MKNGYSKIEIEKSGDDDFKFVEKDRRYHIQTPENNDYLNHTFKKKDNKTPGVFCGCGDGEEDGKEEKKQKKKDGKLKGILFWEFLGCNWR